MLVLLPPSEGKSNAPGAGDFSKREPRLARNARTVLEHVAALKPAERARFYGMKDATKAKSVHAANEAALHGGCVKALERYTGVVYRHLDYPALKRQKDADARIAIVSGFFGLISGATPLPYYKMPINPWLARFWFERNGERLVRLAGRKRVLSLLPQAYARAVPADSLVTVDFRVDGGRKPAGHLGKAVKGKFVRWLIENRVDSVKDFGAFSEDGFEFDGANFIQH